MRSSSLALMRGWPWAPSRMSLVGRARALLLRPLPLRALLLRALPLRALRLRALRLRALP